MENWEQRAAPLQSPKTVIFVISTTRPLVVYQATTRDILDEMQEKKTMVNCNVFNFKSFSYHRYLYLLMMHTFCDVLPNGMSISEKN